MQVYRIIRYKNWKKSMESNKMAYLQGDGRKAVTFLNIWDCKNNKK